MILFLFFKKTMDRNTSSCAFKYSLLYFSLNSLNVLSSIFGVPIFVGFSCAKIDDYSLLYLYCVCSAPGRWISTSDSKIKANIIMKKLFLIDFIYFLAISRAKSNKLITFYNEINRLDLPLPLRNRFFFSFILSIVRNLGERFNIIKTKYNAVKMT